jgi:hypothetical protein
MCGPAHIDAPTTDAPPAISTVPCPRSPLTPQDRTLLFAYFQANDNLATLSASTGHDYFDLLTWLNQPHIQEALDAHDQAVARTDRRAAIEALRESLRAADNPTNLRRAATTLLRSTIARSAQTPRSRDDSHPPSPRSKRGEVSGGPSESKPTDGEGGCSPSHNILSPLPPLPPLPPPTSRPTPNPDPTPTFNNIAAALSTPQLPLALSTIHAHAAHNGAEPPTFAGHPIPTDPATWPDSLPASLPKNFTLPLNIGWAQEVERTDTPTGARSRWLFRATSSSRCFECAITLTKNPDREANEQTSVAQGNPPDPPAWRLASLDILKSLN